MIKRSPKDPIIIKTKMIYISNGSNIQLLDNLG